MYIFHHLLLVTSFSSFCHHQAKYLQSKIRSNSNVFLILVACSTTLLQLVQQYQKLVPPLRYIYQSPIVSYILVHIITHSLCAANFIYKVRVQTSPHLTRTSTCPAKLHTAINSSHHSFTINRLDHLFLPIPHLILTQKFLYAENMLYPRQDYHECKYFLIHEINVIHRDRCENYRGIAFGNAACKILANIILEKIKTNIEKNTREYLNGFRDGRSVIVNIFVLKIIHEKIWEYNQSVQYLFIEFQKAYDSIHRHTLWKCMEEIKIPKKN